MKTKFLYNIKKITVYRLGAIHDENSNGWKRKATETAGKKLLEK